MLKEKTMAAKMAFTKKDMVEMTSIMDMALRTIHKAKDMEEVKEMCEALGFANNRTKVKLMADVEENGMGTEELEKEIEKTILGFVISNGGESTGLGALGLPERICEKVIQVIKDNVEVGK
jgi:hypothetical protein